MTATLGETYAAPETLTAADGAASVAADRRSPRRARRALTVWVAHSAGGHRVVVAMLGGLGFVAFAGALVQGVAG